MISLPELESMAAMCSGGMVEDWTLDDVAMQAFIPEDALVVAPSILMAGYQINEVCQLLDENGVSFSKASGTISCGSARIIWVWPEASPDRMRGIRFDTVFLESKREKSETEKEPRSEPVGGNYNEFPWKVNELDRRIEQRERREMESARRLAEYVEIEKMKKVRLVLEEEKEKQKRTRMPISAASLATGLDQLYGAGQQNIATAISYAVSGLAPRFMTYVADPGLGLSEFQKRLPVVESEVPEVAVEDMPGPMDSIIENRRRKMRIK